MRRRWSSLISGEGCSFADDAAGDIPRIPIRVRNVLNMSFPGTLISASGSASSTMVTGISTIPRVTFVRLEGPGMVGVGVWPVDCLPPLRKRM
jgi:hypothetical protein